MNLNRPINLTFTDSLNLQFRFDRLNKFVDFLKSEQKYWQAAKGLGMPNGQKLSSYVTVADEYSHIINTVISWSKLDDWDDNALKNR